MYSLFAELLAKIAQSTLLDVFSLDELDEIFRQGRFRVLSVPRGTVLHLEGELCNKLELVVSGKLVVERISDSGDLMIVAEFTNNDVLGGGLVFSKAPYYPMTVRTAEQSTLVQISSGVLFELLCSRPAFLRVFLELTSDRTAVLTEKIKHHLDKSLRERIFTFLDNQYRLQKTKEVRLHMSKTILAQKLGVQRTSLSRELKKMQDEGLIAFDHEYITILY